MDEHSFENKYLGVLQNLEAAILKAHRDLPDLVDLQVDSAIESLIRTYQGESTGRNSIIPQSGAARHVYELIHQVAEWRLGRQGYKNDEDQTVFIQKMVSIDEIIDCLKRIRKSIKTWNKSNGRQGYLNYIAMFIK